MSISEVQPQRSCSLVCMMIVLSPDSAFISLSLKEYVCHRISQVACNGSEQGWN